MQSGSGNGPARTARSDNRFAMNEDEASDALAVLLHDNLLNSAESLRGFHVNDGPPD
jgi:hypothetical protein